MLRLHEQQQLHRMQMHGIGYYNEEVGCDECALRCTNDGDTQMIVIND